MRANQNLAAQARAIPKATEAATRRSVAVAGGRYTYLAAGADTADAYLLVEAEFPPHDPGPPLHTHSREDEAFYVLAGELTFTLGDREVAAPAGTFVRAPRGQRHRFRNSIAEPARALILVTPAGIEHFFDAIGADWSGRTDMPPPPTPEEVERIIEMAPQYGISLHLDANNW